MGALAAVSAASMTASRVTAGRGTCASVTAADRQSGRHGGYLE